MTAQKRTPKKAPTPAARKRSFIAAFSETGNVSLAAKAAGIGRRTHYDWMTDDPKYAASFRDARETAGDLLEAEARRRAAEGVEEPVYQGGKRVGTIRRYSDTLLIFLLKGARPEVYRERYEVQHAGEITQKLYKIGPAESS